MNGSILLQRHSLGTKFMDNASGLGGHFH